MGVPLTVGEIVGKMLSFAALTLVAGVPAPADGALRHRQHRELDYTFSGRRKITMNALVVYESMFEHRADCPRHR